jgi:hypothetical protein
VEEISTRCRTSLPELPFHAPWGLWVLRLTCNCCALFTKLAGKASSMLSRFMFSKLFKSIISLLLAKKPATTRPNRPPSPNIHAFFLLLLPFFLSVCSCSAVITRRFEGRVSPGLGDGSRDSMGESLLLAPPKRRRRNDIYSDCILLWEKKGVCRAMFFVAVTSKPAACRTSFRHVTA